ncbi:MAG: ferrous iron transport protein B [Prevotella sp.]
MKLSELQTGETGVIVKVKGHGGFRKRIVEMGFISGKRVEVLLNAPLNDPVKYKIMGYEVSLRHSEADMIEVVSLEEAMKMREAHQTPDSVLTTDEIEDQIPDDDQLLETVAKKKRHTINVALVGNPNCGKTSLFNFASGAHERVGNYAGVTVDAKEGHATFEGYDFILVDLPGTYSLSAYSPEELYVRKQLVDLTPDIVLNVIDSSNLERNLYLTTQLIDMHLRIVCALNMFDEVENRGDEVNYDQLGSLFGIPMVPTVFKTGRGVKELFHKMIELYEGQEDEKPQYRHIHINYGHEIEQGIADIQAYLKKDQSIRQKYSTRFLSIKLLEKDKNAEELIASLPEASKMMRVRDKASARVQEEKLTDSETAIMDAKYGFIHGALQEASYTTGNKKDIYQFTHWIDSIITNRYLGFPIFLALFWMMFEVTFMLGQYPMDWIDFGVGKLAELISQYTPAGPVKDMLVDGIIGGVGAVIIFLPQILILYFFISYMEDSGYMARAAFIMDKLMHKMGLHGKSFIPLVMGFGCTVPAVMATRTIESRKSRLITILILPMISCSARLPIYIMIIGTFFAVKYQSLAMISLYVIGILMTIIFSKLFSKYLIKGEDTPFVMELPPYRFPTWKAIGRHTWEKGKQYIKKMGGIILVASIIVWALGYFPHHEALSKSQQQEESFIGKIGKAIEPAFLPQGFNWKLDVGIVAGVGAKEIVASTIGVLYSTDDKSIDTKTSSEVSNKNSSLREKMTADGITPLTAYSFLLFVLLYFPCVATLAAIRAETGSWKWAAFSALYTTGLAWIVSAVVYQIGRLFF